MEEELPAERTIEAYLDTQTTLLKHYLSEPSVEVSLPGDFPNLQEEATLVVRHKGQDGTLVVQHQLYIVARPFIGILTLTALNSEYPTLLDELDFVFKHFLFSNAH